MRTKATTLLVLTALLPAAALVFLLLARTGAFVSRDSAPLIFAVVLPLVGLAVLLISGDPPRRIRFGLVLLATLLGVASALAHRDFKRQQRLTREQAGKQKLLDVSAPPIPFREALNLKPEHEDTLRRMRGRLVLLDFWATWCSPCLKQMPKLAELQERYAQDVLVTGVVRLETSPENQPQEMEEIRRFVQRLDIHYPILIVDDVDVWRGYRIVALPTSVLVDPNGHVVEYGIGIDGTDRVMVEAERRILQRDDN